MNAEADKADQKRKSRQKKFNEHNEEGIFINCKCCWLDINIIFIYLLLESDCILHGYIKKLGGPFASAWQTRYAKLYPNRLELHSDSGSVKTEVITLDQVLEVSPELVIVKNEQCIVLRMKDGKDGKLVLTNSVSLMNSFTFQFNVILYFLLYNLKICIVLNTQYKIF